MVPSHLESKSTSNITNFHFGSNALSVDQRTKDHFVNLVKNSSYEEIERQLSFYIENVEELLLTKDENDQTVFHEAIRKSDYKICQLLLSFFDSSLAIKFNGKTLTRFAKEVIPTNLLSKKIHALFKWRKEFQKISGNALFFRSLKILDAVIEKNHCGVKKAAVLFLGMTGEGKSTLINYLYGINYTKDSVQKGITPTRNEIVRTGNKTSSETIFPELVNLEKKNYAMVDLPGFGDTRGQLIKLCNSVALNLIVKQLESVQSIVLTISWNSLADPKLLYYRQIAIAVGAMICKDQSLKENLMLVVTKPEHDTEIDFVVDILKKLSIDENWDDLNDIKQEDDVPNEIWKKYCLKMTTEALLTQHKNIKIVDVTSLVSREELIFCLDQLTERVKEVSRYNFSSFSLTAKSFYDQLSLYSQQKKKLILSSEHCLSSLSSTQELIGSRKYELNEKRSRRNAIEAQSKIPFAEITFEKIIQDLNITISELRSSLNSKNNIKEMNVIKYNSTKNMIIALESDRSEVKVNIIPKQKIDYPKISANLKQLAGLPNVLQSRNARTQISIAGNGVNITEIFSTNTQSNVEKQLLTDDFLRAMLYDKTLYYDFEVNNYTYKCDDPECREKIRILNLELESYNRAITDCQNEIYQIEDQIREQENKNIAENLRYKNAKLAFITENEILKMKVHEMDKEIQTLQEELEKLELTEKKIKDQFLSYSLQIRVADELIPENITKNLM